MSTIDKEVSLKIADVTERMLRGDAKDYPAYASLVARYRVLKELEQFLAEQRALAHQYGEDLPDAEE
jgi:hypothetical protein